VLEAEGGYFEGGVAILPGSAVSFLHLVLLEFWQRGVLETEEACFDEDVATLPGSAVSFLHLVVLEFLE
jgi:hypothetical protein